jgi:uncharacterized damage-inducible protein DinB
MRDAVDAVGLARTLVDYNEWATERVLRAADRVPDDLFSQMLPGAGHGSIFGQLRHVAWVQLNYLAGLEANGSAPAEIAAQVKASVDLETRAGIRDAFARGHGGCAPSRPGSPRSAGASGSAPGRGRCRSAST